jgi:hypothetical protein
MWPNLEQFWFTEDTHVVATLGTKGGAICGPVFSYRVTDDDAVEIGSGGEQMYRWERAQISGDVLTVFCKGVSRRFSVTRAPKKERWLP